MKSIVVTMCVSISIFAGDVPIEPLPAFASAVLQKVPTNTPDPSPSISPVPTPASTPNVSPLVSQANTPCHSRDSSSDGFSGNLLPVLEIDELAAILELQKK
jgi:hypothetical protein